MDEKIKFKGWVQSEILNPLLHFNGFREILRNLNRKIGQGIREDLRSQEAASHIKY